MPKLRVNGLRETDPARQSSPLDRGPFKGKLEIKHNVRVNVARAGQESMVLDDVAADDIVELEFDDGIRLWSRVDDYEADFGAQRSRDAGGEVAIDVRNWVSLGGASRGAGEWVLRGLKILGVDVAGSIVDFAKQKIESKLDPGPGLYRCSSQSATDLTAPSKLSGDQPTLVLLHGTGSSCPGGFGGLWSDRSRVRNLFELYGDRVLALQHQTLSASPIENARDLVDELSKILPSGAKLHLVSHSRGGLIGELLARGNRVDGISFDETDLQLFESPDHKHNLDALKELRELLDRNRFTVTRFVRIACPARGTTLASRRLDRYLSIILNVLGRIPQLDNFVFDSFASLLSAVAKKRAEPRDLPGIEAMMPESPLVRMLNRPDVRTNSSLRILGGDVEGTGFWGRLKAFATDLFYREDHDLVVNTPAMFGGVERVATPKYWVDTGGRVNHFNYFVNADTASKLLVALADDDAAGFHDVEVPQGEVTENDYRKRAPMAQPVVFVLPGIMGSTLSVKDDRVWIDRIQLARGRMDGLRMGGSNVEAVGLVEASYGELIRHLAASHEVVPFPYDWRLPLEDSAEALRTKIDEKLDALKGTDQPVRLLAHSMGGLVVRTMLASKDGVKTWERICAHPGGRFIMLGTPNGGSHSIGAMLIGRDRLVKQLALLDLRHPYAKLLAILADFDGSLSLLPQKSEGHLDLYDPNVWQQLHEHDAKSDRGIFGSKPADPSKSADVAWTVPSAARLAKARAAGDVVRSSPLDFSRMLYVAGVAAQTPCDILLDTAAPAGRRVTVLATSRGDGRVPWETGIPPELAKRTYYMDAVHGDLANTEEAFPALVDLLNAGTTTKLSQTPPATRGGKSEKFPLEIEEADIFPDDASLVAAAVGGRRGRKPRRTSERVKVRVVHDNLLWAKSPVLVGHYIDDVFVGAEDFLDRQLDGRLRELHRQELYPGACSTAVVVLDDPAVTSMVRRHPGAIVAGLGQAGELTPGALSATISHALASYGAEAVAMERRQRQRGLSKSDASELPIGVTTLLVGTGAGGVRLADSIHSVLRGVQRANARLAAAREEDKSESAEVEARLIARITSVDILELFEDVAIRAVLELNGLARVSEFRSDFVFNSVLVPGNGGEQRATFDDPPGWWQRVRIAKDKGDLKFESLTDRARVEASLLPTQRTMVRGLLDRAMGTTATDLDLCGTLFEVLVPLELKEQAPDRRRLVLLLDDESAALPWELIYDRWDSGAKPVSVETGMIRQRITSTFRPRPLRASTNCALVIGDPPLDNSKIFSQLPGAAVEATSVATALREKGFETTALIEQDAQLNAVLSAFYGKAYRVVHIAAHGVYKYKNESGEEYSGVVLGKDAFLTAASFKQMRVVPDLVFINCCHLGHDRDYGRAVPIPFTDLAANVGEELINMGVRAVVAAGWAVDDQAADAFARTFYDEMLHGQEFGVAVQRARQEIFSGFAAVNTWGAYQCYGEPGFTLVSESGMRDDDRFVAERQFCIEVTRLANNVRGNSKAKAEILKRLELLVSAAEPEWRTSGITAAAIAQAYGELGRFKEATTGYERVLVTDPATASLRSVEQLANLLSREAARQDKPDLAVMRRSATLLETLTELGKNAERFSLLGGTHKRLAEKTKAANRLSALKSMEKAYEKAYELAKKDKTRNAWYPLTNLVAARVALSWQTKAPKHPDVGMAMDELREYARTAPESATDFWGMMLPADVQLLEAVIAGKLSPKDRKALESAFRDGARRAGTPKEVASATGQIKFFREMARLSPNGEIKKFGASLDELIKALE